MQSGKPVKNGIAAGFFAILVAAGLMSCARGGGPEKVSLRPVSVPGQPVSPVQFGPIPQEFSAQRETSPAQAEPAQSVNAVDPPESVISFKNQRIPNQADQRITLSLAEPVLESALAVLAEVSGIKFAPDPELRKLRLAPISLQDVSWFSALEVIMRANNLMAVARDEEIFFNAGGFGPQRAFGKDDIITITTYEKNLRLQEAMLKSADASIDIAERRRKAVEERIASAMAAQSGQMETRSYRFRYADPVEAVEYLERLFIEYDKETLKNSTAQASTDLALEQSGSAGLNRTTGQMGTAKDTAAVTKLRRSGAGDVKFAIYKPENLLTIQAPAKKMLEIMDRILEIDVNPKQVYIEARIVEIQRNQVNELGIQWGGRSNFSTDLTFPNAIGVYGGGSSISGESSIVSLPPQSAVDPATGQLVSNPQGGVLGVSLGGVSGSISLQARLFALEQAGMSRTLSNPKVVAINGARALIKSGREIPYQASSANTGTTVLFKEAVISLAVTPLIMQDGKIRLKIDAKKDEVDPGLSVQGTPAIKKKEITTNVVVPNGGSAVLGGMLEGEDSDFEDRVPGLHETPLLGWLFKNRRKVDNELELLVFITPIVIEPGKMN
ncbi:MAG: hypothetical protein HY751_00850 [Nitrospinae bacterium]|nr:hypothetical protein [Nitrospinota bacterium]